VSERPLRLLPPTLIALLLGALAAQVAWRLTEFRGVREIAHLGPPPSPEFVRLASLSEGIAAAKLMTLHVQAHDRQPGLMLPLEQLDYELLERWLTTILRLDPPANYPLLMASRIYAEVGDPARSRRMMEFVYREFHRNPQRFWPWLAHCAVLAKHRLRDLPLALRYARAIRLKATEAPAWARDLEILVLQDMQEIEAARILVGGLLDSGKITERAELLFLREKLKELEERAPPRP
jgi:hypothetical protein